MIRAPRKGPRRLEDVEASEPPAAPPWLAGVLAEVRSRRVPLVYVAGFYLRNGDLTDQEARRVLARHGGDPKPAEHDMNRYFVVADILDELVPGEAWTSTALCEVAATLADALRQQLRAAFPERRFEVEIIGADDGDPEAFEPLEVCVTFSRAASSS